MDSFAIGLSGLSAAKKSLDVIGNNIANAATPGYHRQRVNLRPAYLTQTTWLLQGGGVEFERVSRDIDIFLENEILRQASTLAQLSQKLAVLEMVETAFGELSGEGLSKAIDDFFLALDDLSAHCGESIYQNKVVAAAENMTSQFRILGNSLNEQQRQVALEAENKVEDVNTLLNQIGELNGQIQNIEITGAQANNIRDQRDQCIAELSELVSVSTNPVEYGVVNLSINGIPSVTGTEVNEFEVDVLSKNTLGISIKDQSSYSTDVQGGKLSALFSLYNELIPEISSGLDDLASAIIQQVNQYHVQGVGSYGSFTELTGWTNLSGDLSDFSTVSAGYTYIRVTNTSSGAVTRTAIPVMQDASSDTLAEIASYITTNVANVNASVNSSSNQLSISADTGYEFDFIPAVLPEPEAADISFSGLSDPAVSVSGIYTGSSNDTLTFTVSGTGDVGVDGLTLTVTDSALNTIDTINIGSGYAAGDEISVGNTGIKISLSTGDLADGDSFSMDVFADTDTSGLLSAVGLNTFFSGSKATDIAVCSQIIDSPARIATSVGPQMSDNSNIVQLAGLKDEAVSSLDSLSPGNFYRRLVANIGQQVSTDRARQENSQTLIQNLMNQRDQISGVDINDEAAQMLVIEQMFQAMSKYLQMVQSSLMSVMEIM